MKKTPATATQRALFAPPCETDAARAADAPALPAPPSRPRRPRRAAAAPLPGLCVLGSGSGGNCAALRVEGRLVLIDLGMGPRTIARRLAQAGHDWADVEAVLVTHFDRDHVKPACVRLCAGLGVRLFCHRWHAPELLAIPGGPAMWAAGLVTAFEESDVLTPLPALSATFTRVQHDRQGCIAYRLDAADPRGAVSFGYATDLGHAPPALIELLAGVDVLAIESNYDEHMTVHSPRPSFVNRRNLSDSGHLSNEQSRAAVRAIADAGPAGNPRRVVLLHRSSQCNHPTKVRRCFAQDAELCGRVVLAEQRRRTAWLAASPLPRWRRAQLRLCWSAA